MYYLPLNYLSKSYLKVIGTKVKFTIEKSSKIALIVFSNSKRHLAIFMTIVLKWHIMHTKYWMEVRNGFSVKKKLEPECNPSVMREIFNSKKLHGVPSEPQRWLGGQQKDHALRFWPVALELLLRKQEASLKQTTTKY